MFRIETAWILKVFAGLAAGSLCSLVLPINANRIIAAKNRMQGREESAPVLFGPKGKCLLLAADAVFSAGIALLLPAAAAAAAIVMLQLMLLSILTDQAIRVIANEIVLLLLGLAVCYRWLSGGVGSFPGALGALGLTALVFGGSAALMMLKSGTPGVGGGDLKYAMVLSIAVGWENIIWFFGGMAGALLLYCVIGIAGRKLGLLSCFPMCLHLSIGFYCALVLPEIVPYIAAQ